MARLTNIVFNLCIGLNSSLAVPFHPHSKIPTKQNKTKQKTKQNKTKTKQYKTKHCKVLD